MTIICGLQSGSAGTGGPQLSQFPCERCCCIVYAQNEAAAAMSGGRAPFELETIFCAQYERIARVIGRVVRNHARAEELAVEVFLKLWRTRRAQGEKAEGWLYRTAVRTALNELRAEARRNRYERLADAAPA